MKQELANKICEIFADCDTTCQITSSHRGTPGVAFEDFDLTSIIQILIERAHLLIDTNGKSLFPIVDTIEVMTFGRYGIILY